MLGDLSYYIYCPRKRDIVDLGQDIEMFLPVVREITQVDVSPAVSDDVTSVEVVQSGVVLCVQVRLSPLCGERTGMSEMGPKWVKFGPKWDKSGTFSDFQIRFQYILAEPKCTEI